MQFHVDNTIVVIALMFCLETNANPSIALVGTLKVQSLNRISKRKKTRGFYSMRQPFGEQLIFMIEHSHQTVFAYIAFASTVDGIAEFHVIGRHGFSNGATRSAYFKKVGCCLLPGSYLCKRTVNVFA